MGWMDSGLAVPPECSRKPRLMVPITVQFSVRYLLRTGLLRSISEYAQPVAVLGWDDPELEQELEGLGAEVHRLPRKQIGGRYARIQTQLTQWHLRRINTPTTSIDRRRNWKLSRSGVLKSRRALRDVLYSVLTRIRPYRRQLLAQQARMVWTDTNLPQYAALVEKVRPDALISLTPYFIEEELLLRGAASLRIPMATAILSFDNLTTRGYIPVRFDAYFLWNEYNRAELERIYPETATKSVTLVGAPQFDFYYDPAYIWTEERWRSELRLPAGRPVILFGSASRIIAPQEEQWLKHIDEAIMRGEVQGDPIIVLRRHPNESVDRWTAFVAASRNIVLDEPWPAGREIMGKTNVARFDIERLASTLHHSSVHINASSTMTVDGAIFDRPQIGPAYDENGGMDREAKEIYLREHYLPITRSGGLTIARSRAELLGAINSALDDPGRLSAQRQRLVQEICTFTDGHSTDRINKAIQDFLRRLERASSQTEMRAHFQTAV